jgi:hypothetical protein
MPLSMSTPAGETGARLRGLSDAQKKEKKARGGGRHRQGHKSALMSLLFHIKLGPLPLTTQQYLTLVTKID